MHATDPAPTGAARRAAPDAPAAARASATRPTGGGIAGRRTDGSRPHQTVAAAETSLAADLYALVVHLHKNCTADLFEAVGALDLSLSQIKLLAHLEDTPAELTVKDVAEKVHVSLPAASRMVDDLVRRQLLVRHEDVDDRRMKRVRLTGQGRAVIRRLNAARLNGLEEFVAGLAPAEQRALSRALSKLLARAEVAACRPERVP